MRKARAKSGKRCRARATPNGYCSIHQSPERAAELSQKAVAARRRIAEDTLTKALMEVPTTVEELLNTLGKVFVDVRAGKIDVATARVMGNVAQVIMKGFELLDANNQKNPTRQAEDAIDPADLTTEEWERRYGHQLGAPYVVNSQPEAPELRTPAIPVPPAAVVSR